MMRTEYEGEIMKVSYDKESDALYFSLDETAEISDTEEVKPGVILDLDKKGNFLGVEILNVSKITSAKSLKRTLVEMA
jgi:uncharacterized protein YuzE